VGQGIQLKKCFSVHTSSILHGALIGAGSSGPEFFWGFHFPPPPKKKRVERRKRKAEQIVKMLKVQKQ